MGRSYQNIGVCIEPHSTQSTQEQDSWRSFLWQETKIQPSQNILMSCIHTHSERKEDGVRSFRKEGYICGILLKLEGLQNIFPGIQEYWHQQGCDIWWRHSLQHIQKETYWRTWRRRSTQNSWYNHELRSSRRRSKFQGTTKTCIRGNFNSKWAS